MEPQAPSSQAAKPCEFASLGGNLDASGTLTGTQGRLWRPGDGADPPLLIQDERGGWRPVKGENLDEKAPPGVTAQACYRRFAQMVKQGAEHPLSGDSALADLEVIMAIFESARLRRKIELPLQQERFPLEIMVEEGGS